MAGGDSVSVKEKVFVTANGEKPLELCVMGEDFSRVRPGVEGVGVMWMPVLLVRVLCIFRCVAVLILKGCWWEVQAFV